MIEGHHFNNLICDDIINTMKNVPPIGLLFSGDVNDLRRAMGIAMMRALWEAEQGTETKEYKHVVTSTNRQHFRQPLDTKSLTLPAYTVPGVTCVIAGSSKEFEDFIEEYVRGEDRSGDFVFCTHMETVDFYTIKNVKAGIEPHILFYGKWRESPLWCLWSEEILRLMDNPQESPT